MGPALADAADPAPKLWLTRHPTSTARVPFADGLQEPAFSGVSGAWLRSRYPDTRRERHRVSSSEVKAPRRALRRERPVDYPTGSNAWPQAQV